MARTKKNVEDELVPQDPQEGAGIVDLEGQNETETIQEDNEESQANPEDDTIQDEDNQINEEKEGEGEGEGDDDPEAIEADDVEINEGPEYLNLLQDEDDIVVTPKAKTIVAEKCFAYRTTSENAVLAQKCF